MLCAKVDELLKIMIDWLIGWLRCEPGVYYELPLLGVNPAVGGTDKDGLAMRSLAMHLYPGISVAFMCAKRMHLLAKKRLNIFVRKVNVVWRGFMQYLHFDPRFKVCTFLYPTLTPPLHPIPGPPTFSPLPSPTLFQLHENLICC